LKKKTFAKRPYLRKKIWLPFKPNWRGNWNCAEKYQKGFQQKKGISKIENAKLMVFWNHSKRNNRIIDDLKGALLRSKNAQKTT